MSRCRRTPGASGEGRGPGVRAASAANGHEQPLGQALELLAAQLADKEAVIDDLRRRLDRADEQRQQA